MVFLRCACVAILLAATGVQARAQDAPSPEALAAAEELLSVTSPDVSKQLLTQMNRLIWPVIEQQIARRNSVDDATVADLRAEFERLQLKQLNELLKAGPQIY